MADADEDAIHHPSSTSTNDPSIHIETDLSDETQDFRLLNHISLLSDPTTQTTLPKRGEKDFEPNPTNYQSDVLSASRQAMHNALSFPRLHHPKQRVVGVFAPGGPAPPSSITGPSSSSKSNSNLSNKEGEVGGEGGGATAGTKTTTTTTTTTTGVSPHTCVYVTNPKGQYFRTMGQADRWNRIWLLPEEALYLLERGSLDIRWPEDLTSSTTTTTTAATTTGEEKGSTEEGKGKDETENETQQEKKKKEPEPEIMPPFPMSLQAAYACLLGRGGLTPERFSVYTGLRRLGYTLIRAPGWDECERDGDHGDNGAVGSEESGTGTGTVARPQQGQGLVGLLGRLFRWIYESSSSGSGSGSGSTVTGPVVGVGIHRNYNDIYRKLSLIPWYDPTTTPTTTAATTTKNQTTPPFRTTFHVYKPSTPFRKSNPPEPDFRIAVINARTQPSIPTSAQLGALLETTPLDPPRGEKMSRLLYMRLRHGYRNVILAVVDQGVVSYIRIGDAAFGKERIYEEKGGFRSKHGPRPKQRGR